VEQKHLSSLQNIHVAVLVPSSCISKYGYESILKPLISDLRTLETEGMSIKTDADSKTIKGTIATISADNLAAHDIGGFRKTFSSGHVCRFCMITHDNLSNFQSESDTDFPPLRTADVHADHVAAVSMDSALASSYGVRGDCAFSSLDSFCTVRALPPDIMHDLLEGVIP
jgi:hypothetical protein